MTLVSDSFFSGFLIFHILFWQVSILFDKFSSYTSQCSDILGMQDTQWLTVFRCSIGCNFSDLKPSLIAGFSSAIPFCHPCLCIPVSSLCWLQCLPDPVFPVFSTVSQHKTDLTIKASVFWWFSTLCQLSWSWPKKAGWKESETLAGSTEISLGCHRANLLCLSQLFLHSSCTYLIKYSFPFNTHLTLIGSG